MGMQNHLPLKICSLYLLLHIHANHGKGTLESLLYIFTLHQSDFGSYDFLSVVMKKLFSTKMSAEPGFSNQPTKITLI